MSPPPIEIIPGLPEQYRRPAAEIYHAAFRQKLAPLVGSRERGVALIEKILDPRYGLLALREAACVGLAGLHIHGRSFVQPHASAFIQTLGWWRGLPGYLGFRIFSSAPPQDALHIECLAVSPAQRGQGVGTRLLAAVFDLARAQGFGAVSLEVVDTNPDARRLYERQGFVATKTDHYPYLRPFVGFSASTTMVKPITP